MPEPSTAPASLVCCSEVNVTFRRKMHFGSAPVSLQFDSLCASKPNVHFGAEIADGRLDLRKCEQQLYCHELSRLPVDLRDLDVFTLQEWEADPIRRDLFVPMGFGWGIATWIPVPTGDMLIVHGERHLDAGPPDDETVRRLDALRPHLARAVLLSSRMAFRQMSTAAQILGIVGIPAAVLGPGGRILAANDLLEAMAPEVVQPRPSRIGLASPTADAQLAQALERMSRPHEYSAVQSIPIPARDEHPPCLVHLYPVRHNARDLFSGASTVLLVTPVRLKEVPSASVIQGLFDLTAAEAKIARGIGEGLTVEQLSRRDQVSLATVRNQLRSVFDKTGMKRQAELASLLQGISRGGAAGPQAS